MTKLARKTRHTAAEVANDPSVRWCGYRIWELVYSDTHAADLRFHHYDAAGRVVLATLAMTVLPGAVDPLTVRRPSVMPDRGHEALTDDQRRARLAGIVNGTLAARAAKAK